MLPTNKVKELTLYLSIKVTGYQKRSVTQKENEPKELRPRERKELSQSHMARRYKESWLEPDLPAFGACNTHTNSSRNQRKTGSPAFSCLVTTFVKNGDKC